MAAIDPREDLAALEKSLQSIEAVLDPSSKSQEIAELQEQAAAPDLWNDQENAQRVTSRLSALQSEVDRLTGLRGRIEDVEVMLELADEEDDPATRAEAEREIARLASDVSALEVRTTRGSRT